MRHSYDFNLWIGSEVYQQSNSYSSNSKTIQHPTFVSISKMIYSSKNVFARTVGTSPSRWREENPPGDAI